MQSACAHVPPRLYKRDLLPAESDLHRLLLGGLCDIHVSAGGNVFMPIGKTVNTGREEKALVVECAQGSLIHFHGIDLQLKRSKKK